MVGVGRGLGVRVVVGELGDDMVHIYCEGGKHHCDADSYSPCLAGSSQRPEI